MPVQKPFYRCVRPGPDGFYGNGLRWRYVKHPDYARDAVYYIRAFSILQADLLKLFEYIEPADCNQTAYSYRCLDLLVRASGEVEANCRAILEANDYQLPPRRSRPNMEDYKKLDATHRLSSYRVKLPVWTGNDAERRPFGDWASAGTLPWFEAHHGGKHNRQQEFPKANFAHVVDAVSAVAVLLAAQFWICDFGPGEMFEGCLEQGAFEQAIGGYFQVRFPDDWPDEQRYAFGWGLTPRGTQPFDKLTFSP